jgi:hypothetical protein
VTALGRPHSPQCWPFGLPCVVGLEIEEDAMKVKLGFVLWAITLLSVADASSAEQLVRAGYPPFGAPLSSLPSATLNNYGSSVESVGNVWLR